MILNPFKHVERILDLFGRDESGEEVVLEEMIRGIVLLFLLVDEARGLEVGDVGDETLFGNLPKCRLLQKIQKGFVLVSPEDRALHLALGRFPGRSFQRGPRLLDDKEVTLVKGLGTVVEEARRS